MSSCAPGDRGHQGASPIRTTSSLLVTKHSDTNELLTDIMAFKRIQKGCVEIHVTEKPLRRGRTNKESDKSSVKSTTDYIKIKSEVCDV